MRRPSLPALLLLAFVGAVTASVACSNQGEGEFCSSNNGNNDCQDGLECIPAPGVNATTVNRDRCCPIPPAQPTTAECSLPTTTLIDAATEVPDVIPGSGPDAEAGSAAEASAPIPDAGAGTAQEASAVVPDAHASTPDAGPGDALAE
jgi:hypothetical protein